jgi:hypothetical protein
MKLKRLSDKIKESLDASATPADPNGTAANKTPKAKATLKDHKEPKEVKTPNGKNRDAKSAAIVKSEDDENGEAADAAATDAGATADKPKNKKVKTEAKRG